MHIAAAALLACSFAAGDALAARTGKKPLWGAIAWSGKSDAYGYAVDMKTRRDAETAAFRQCGSGCDQVKAFRDACAAVAAKPKRAVAETGASREIAEAKALRKCGDACAVKAWACTAEK